MTASFAPAQLLFFNFLNIKAQEIYKTNGKNQAPPERPEIKHLDAAHGLDVLWCQPIKLIQVDSTSEFQEY